MAEDAKNRHVRKERVGRVVSNKMAKTLIVDVERRWLHPLYGKVVRAHKRFYAHDEKGEARVGDTVRITETRPMSKLKRWRLTAVVDTKQGDSTVGLR